jgi:hypothetical protein
MPQEEFTLTEIYDAMQAGEDADYCECGGEGWIAGDCDEDCCCCADPELEHGFWPCPICNPTGV